jgi:hypothetical protein
MNLFVKAHFELGDAHAAVQHTERAVLVLERLKGFDHEATVRAYGNLALFYNEAGELWFVVGSVVLFSENADCVIRIQ